MLMENRLRKRGEVVEKQARFSYAVLSDLLEEQANEQGYTLGDKVEKLEEIRKAINMCMLHVATESQVKAMRTKLNDLVIKSLKQK